MNSLIGLFFGILAMVSFGVQDFIMAGISKKIGAFKTTLWFQVIMTIILIILAVFLYNYKPLSPVLIGLILLTAVVSVGGIFSFNKGLHVGNVSIIVTVTSAFGAITAILGVIFLGDKLSYAQVLYVTLIIIGTILVSLNLKGLSSRRGKLTVGVKYALITVFCWGLFYFLTSVLVKALDWFSAAFLVIIPTLIILFIYGKIVEEETSLPKGNTLSLIAISILCTTGLLAYNLGVTYNYTAIVAPTTAAGPMITILLAIIFLKEKLAINQVIGIILVMSGLILLSL